VLKGNRVFDVDVNSSPKTERLFASKEHTLMPPIGHQVLGVPPHEGITLEQVAGHVLDNVILAVTLDVVS
jgi:hypothetical protein